MHAGDESAAHASPEGLRGAFVPLTELRAALSLMVLAALMVAALASPAHAETFAVTKTSDTNDGSCTAADCSLREAVVEANAAPGADTITLRARTYVLTIPGANEDASATGDLDTSGTIAIRGEGAGATTISAGGGADGLDDRVLDVVNDSDATLAGLKVSGGNPPNDPSRFDESNGGGISNFGAGDLELNRVVVSGNAAGTDGGGIYNVSGTTGVGTLTITDSTIRNNEADDGGGIDNDDSTFKLIRSTVRNNTADDDGGGIDHDFSSMRVADSAVSYNTANGGSGGGISSEDGTVKITGSSLSSNTAQDIGGGLESDNSALTITSSTVSGNEAEDGGGVYSNSELAGEGESNIVRNSTFSGNTAEDSGGGYFNYDGLTVLENVTVTANAAPRGRGAGVVSVGDNETITEVSSSVIAANDSTDVDTVSGIGTNSFVSEGYNVIGDGNATGAFSGPGDQTGVTNPGLKPLADNGGPTQTHALRPGSPAIDRVAAGECPPPAEDQRGEDRPRDGDGNGSARCDSGAFEKAPPPPPERPACDDGRDNDGDGKTDLRDPGCSSRQDDSEKNRPGAGRPECTITGTVGDDVLTGTDGRDVICAKGGDDTVQSLDRNDIVFGGGGDDSINGGDGDDRLYGGAGRDSINGGDGRDTIKGGRGNDSTNGGPGRDQVDTGSGENASNR